MITSPARAEWKRDQNHGLQISMLPFESGSPNITATYWFTRQFGVSPSPRQRANLSRTGGPANSGRLIFPKHKRLIPLFFTEGVRAEKQERKNEKSNNIREVRLVFGESVLGSKIRYPDPEVTLIRDNKKMSDFCVQDRKRALSKGSRRSSWQTQSHPTKKTLYLKRKKEGNLFSSSF